jgi:hypothetical protein
MVPLRTSESDPFPVAIGVGHDNARAIGTDGGRPCRSSAPLGPEWVITGIRPMADAGFAHVGAPGIGHDGCQQTVVALVW